MKFLDILSIVSGIASILSLLLSLRERFAAWRKYVLPLSYGLGGFAAGRISASFAASGTSTATESYPSGVLILFIAVLAIISIATFTLLKRNEPWIAYLVLFMGLSSAAPQVMKSFSESSSHVPAGDLLLLAADKERVSDLSGAITYLEKAAQATSDNDMKAQINSKIKILQTKLTESISAPASVSSPHP
jgi:hypothetical protein